MSSSSVETMPRSAETNGYERSRLNALRHGILSRHRVLPWEDRSEYDDLLESLMAEHAPYGPTEHHLVEELASILWRKQRLSWPRPPHTSGAASRTGREPAGRRPCPVRALAHLDGGEPTEAAAAAIRATAEGTEAELRDLTEDQVMTERALTILRRGQGPTLTQGSGRLARGHPGRLVGDACRGPTRRTATTPITTTMMAKPTIEPYKPDP